MAVLYASRWWDSGKLQDAVLADVLAGLAIFTKQSALTWLVSLETIPVLWCIATQRQVIARRRQRVVEGLDGIAIPAIVIALPWYVRNGLLSGWGNVLPVAGLYHLLETKTGWLGLLPTLAWPRDFGQVLAWAYASGWVVGTTLAAWQGWRILKGKQDTVPTDLILAVMIIPYWLVWWTTFSFDPRFLLLILPLKAIWAARLLAWGVTWLGERVRMPRLAGRIGGAALLLGLLLWGSQDRLAGVYWAVAQPLATDEQKLLRAKERFYSLVLYIRENLDPENDRLMLMDGRMAYYLRDFDTLVCYPIMLADLEGYDYLVHSSSIFAVYNERLGWNNSEFYRHVWDPLIFEPVYESDGVHIMRILGADLPSPEEYKAYRRSRSEDP